MGVAEERLHAEHVLAHRGFGQVCAHVAEGVAHILDGGDAQAAFWEPSQEGLAVTSKFRWVWAEPSQDFSSASSDSARVALTRVIGKLVGTLGHMETTCFRCSIISNQ